MKNGIVNFVLGSSVALGSITQLGGENGELPPEVIEAIRLFVSTLTGLISVIIMRFLARKFPNIFGKKGK